MEKTMTRADGQDKVRQLVLTGVMAAMACAATLVIRVPSPTGGYMNLGDTVVLLGGYLLGPVWGALAGGIGSGIADLLAGAPIYIPATVVIKAVMAAMAAGLYRCFGRRSLGALILCGAVCEIPMVVGYWLFDGLVTVGSLAGAAAGLPSNFVQAAFGLSVSTALTAALRHSGAVRKTFPDL